MTDPGPVISEFTRGYISQALPFEGQADTLTVCMIVRDEAERIEEAIENFQSFADEIVVVDTGSEDGTQKILQSLPVKFAEMQWSGDFSAARNRALDEASCSWVIWLDADDRVVREDVETLKMFKKAPRDRVFIFELINAPENVSLGESYYQMRMFPNAPSIRFSGRVHEDVRASVEELGLHRVYTKLKIRHTGYRDPAEVQKKALRNLEILQAVPEEEQDALILSRQADSYAMMGDWGPAIELYVQAWERPECKEDFPVLYWHLPVLIGRCYQSAGKLDAALEWFQRSVYLFESKADAYYYAGEIHRDFGQEEEAEEAWRFVLWLKPQFDALGNRAPLIRMFAYDALCRLLAKQERWQELLEISKGFFQEFNELVEPRWHLGLAFCRLGQHENALRQLEAGLLMVPQGEPQVWECLLESYEKSNNTMGLEYAKQRYDAVQSS